MMMNNCLSNQLLAAKFAMWELHLYLDTHPDDCQAMSLWEQYAQKVHTLTKEYERMYGPLTVKSGSGAKWTKEPWPWQKECR